MAAPSVCLFRKFGQYYGSLYGRYQHVSQLFLTSHHIRNGLTPWNKPNSSRYITTANILTPEKVFIDTSIMVNNMEDSGFSREQAQCLSDILVTILTKEAQFKSSELVTIQQKEIMMQQIMSHIAALRKDMIILEKSEFSSLKAENEKLKAEINQLKTKLKDELKNLRNNVSLDMNLEKSRGNEMSASHVQSIENNNHRITTEVANMMAKLEATKNDLLKYFAGILLGSITIGLGLYRIILVS